MFVNLKSWSRFLTRTLPPRNKKIDKWMNETLQAKPIFQKSGDVILNSDGPQSLVSSLIQKKGGCLNLPAAAFPLKFKAEMGIPSRVCGWVWKGLLMSDPRGAQHNLLCKNNTIAVFRYSSLVETFPHRPSASVAKGASSKNWPVVGLVFMRALSTFKWTIFY